MCAYTAKIGRFFFYGVPQMKNSLAAKLLALLITSLFLIVGSGSLIFALKLKSSTEELVQSRLSAGAYAVSYIVRDLDVAAIDLESAKSDVNYELWQTVVKAVKDSGVTYLYVMRKEGPDFVFVLAADEDPKNLDADPTLMMEYHDAPEEVEHAFSRDAPVFTTKPFTDQWGTFQSLFIPLPDASGKVVGVIGADFDITALQRLVTLTLVTNLAPAFIISVALSILLAIFLMRIVIRPIRSINVALGEIATGEADLGKRIAGHGHDEIGTLAEKYNHFAERLRLMVVNIKGQLEHATTVQQDLSASAIETSASITEISANIQSMTNFISILDEKLDVMSARSGKVASISDELTRIAGVQQEATEESIGSVGKLLVDIKGITETTERIAGLTIDLVKKSELGVEHMDDTSRIVEDITELVVEIGGMLSVINSIAGKTNLLAMNAAIEAAHAGDAGRGFAVVADEIRKLADTSSQNASSIKKALKEIVQRSQKATHLATTTRQSFSEIDASVHETGRAFEDILERARKVSGEVASINEQLERVGEYSVSTWRDAQAMNEAALDAGAASTEVERLSREVSGGMDEINIGTRDIATAFQSVADDARKVQDINRAIQEEVGRFKT
jgi:methyl-accepting chemotaxis protein